MTALLSTAITLYMLASCMVLLFFCDGCRENDRDAPGYLAFVALVAPAVLLLFFVIAWPLAQMLEWLLEVTEPGRRGAGREPRA